MNKNQIVFGLIVLLWFIIVISSLIYINELREANRNKITYEMAQSMTREELLEYIKNKQEPRNIISIILPLLSIGGFGIGAIAFWVVCVREGKNQKDVILRAILLGLREEEKKIMELVLRHKMLPQATIRSVTGLSKMKLSRIIEKLRKRKLLNATKESGRINVELSQHVKNLLE